MANRGEISAINCLFYLLKNEQAPFSAPHSTELRAGFARAKRGSLDLTLAKMKRRPQGSSFSFWRRRGDSNSRYRSLHTNDLANRPLQPLGYSSVCCMWLLVNDFSIRNRLNKESREQSIGQLHNCFKWRRLELALTFELLEESWLDVD